MILNADPAKPTSGNSYTVAKMQLLSTSFRRIDGKYVWIGHTILATKVIENVRRSGPTHETFTFEVAFDTSFEALQSLRARMLHFCKENGRDFLPIFDVVVDDIPGQGKMVLKADIKCVAPSMPRRIQLTWTGTRPTGSRARSRCSGGTSGSVRSR